MSEWAQILGGVGEFVGAIAVVVTLIYLTRQMRQNTAGLRASAYQTWVAATTAHLGVSQSSTALARTILQGLEKPSELGEDWLQFAFWCHQFVLITEATFHLHQDGIISDSIFEKEFQRTASLLETPGGSEWWKAGARTQFSDEFVEALENAGFEGGALQPYRFTPGRGFHPWLTEDTSSQ